MALSEALYGRLADHLFSGSEVRKRRIFKVELIDKWQIRSRLSEKDFEQPRVDKREMQTSREDP